MSGNLRDGNIFQDFTVWIRGKGKIGAAPGFQPPEINIQTEDFRGGGMDGTVEIPFGIEKIEFDFDLHTWDEDIFAEAGYGAGAIDVPLMFRGYVLTANGAHKGVVIDTLCLVKSIKPSKIEAGSKAELNVSCVAHSYLHKVNDKVIHRISVFDKVFEINGVDKSADARRILGFTY